MDRAVFAVPQHQAATPLTDRATFTVTSLDLGTPAVRPGVALQLEQERTMLLLAARLALGRIRAGNVAIGAPYEFALEQAIKLAEANPDAA